MTDERLSDFVKELQRHIDEEEERIYSETVRREATFPFHMERMTEYHGRSRYTGPCGDTMEIFLRVDGGRIADASFLTDGCAATKAVGSMLMRLIIGGKVRDASKLTPEDLIEALDGLPEENVHCAEMGIATLGLSIEDLMSR